METAWTPFTSECIQCTQRNNCPPYPTLFLLTSIKLALSMFSVWWCVWMLPLRTHGCSSQFACLAKAGSDFSCSLRLFSEAGSSLDSRPLHQSSTSSFFSSLCFPPFSVLLSVSIIAVCPALSCQFGFLVAFYDCIGSHIPSSTASGSRVSQALSLYISTRPLLLQRASCLFGLCSVA